MAAFLQPPGDDTLALIGCGVVLLVSVLTLQLVHFIQHRRRPKPPPLRSSRAQPDSPALPAARTRSRHDSAV